MARKNSLDEAALALQDYWGATGQDRNGTAMRSTIRKLRLRRSDIDELLDALPPITASPTGDRVAECSRVLTTLRAG